MQNARITALEEELKNMDLDVKYQEHLENEYATIKLPRARFAAMYREHLQTEIACWKASIAEKWALYDALDARSLELCKALGF